MSEDSRGQGRGQGRAADEARGPHFGRHVKDPDPGLDSAGGGVLWDVLRSHDMGRLELLHSCL